MALLKRAVGSLVGGELNLDFDILSSKMTIRSTAEEIDPETIRTAVSTTGMTAFPWEDFCAGRVRRAGKTSGSSTVACSCARRVVYC